MLTIAIINEIPITRGGLGLILEAHYKEVKILEAESPTAFTEPFASSNIDLVIFISGTRDKEESIDFIEIIKKNKYTPSIIFFEETVQYDLLAKCVKAGIKGYLTTKSSLHEIVNCCETILAGSHYANAHILELLIFGVSHKTSILKKHQKALSDREKEIANYLILGMKTSDIAKSLNRKPSTISSIKGHFFRKLAVENILQLKEAMNKKISESHKN